MSEDERYRLAYQAGLAFLNPHSPDAVLLRLARQHLKTSASVLEIGCGEGFDAVALSELGLEVTALDASPWAIRRVIEAHPSSHVRFVVGAWPEYAHHLNRSYDLIVDIGCLHTIESKERRKLHLEAVRKSLHPRGWLYFRVGTDSLPGGSRGASPRSRPLSLPVWWELPNGETIVLPAPARGWRPCVEELCDVFRVSGLQPNWVSVAKGITYPHEIVGCATLLTTH